MEDFSKYSHKIKRLLTYLSEQYEIPDIKRVYEEVLESESHVRCQIKLMDRSGPCSLRLVDEKCPYHGTATYDFSSRQCQFQMDRRRCAHFISGKDARNMTIIYCKSHQCLSLYDKPLNEIELFSRIGEYIVIDETTFVLSDDMTSIIGYTELTPTGKIVLQSKYKEGMDSYTEKYGLNLEFDH